jgi:addiction module HigA family antidote
MAVRLHSSIAAHPGPWLRAELIEPRGLGVSQVAAALRVTRQAMSMLLNGRTGLSATMAVRFEKAFGISAATLLRMQAAFDLAKAREEVIEVDPIAA